MKRRRMLQTEQHVQWMAANENVVAPKAATNHATVREAAPFGRQPHDGAELVGKWLQVQSTCSGSGVGTKPRRGYVMGYESAQGRLRVVWDDNPEV